VSGEELLQMDLMSPAITVPYRLCLRVLVAAALLAAHGAALPVHAANATFTVTTDNDRPDDQPGDGRCNNAGFLATRCSLRAAIMEANALAGTHTILVPPGT
jgi:CSLREA domain-containing protein